MNPLRRFQAFLRQERLFLKQNKEQVGKANRKLFLPLMSCGAACYVPMLITTFFVKVYEPLRPTYIVMLVLLLASVAAVYFMHDSRMMGIYYFTYLLIGGYAAYSSAFLTPDYVGVMILLFLFEIQILLLDHTERLILFELLIAGLYLAIVLPHKDPRLLSDEIVNTIVFALIGSVMGAFFRTSRLENIDLSRRLNLERTTDELTGLSNRRMLFEYFGKYETAQTTVPTCALAILDIDNFKQYNDTYGHLAGDKCLRQLGACFREFGAQHQIDFYRYGGEEFIALVHQPPSLPPAEFFRQLNQAVVALHIPHSYLSGGYVTVSIGVIRIADTDDTVVKFEQAIEKADQALYQVKNSGKGTALEYSPEAVHDEADRRAASRKQPRT